MEADRRDSLFMFSAAAIVTSFFNAERRIDTDERRGIFAVKRKW
jgi:hypothetical protein